MRIQDILFQAGKLVPTAYTTEDQIGWLNSINFEFFDVVKIPKTEIFSAVSGTTSYTLTGNIKEKNVDKVMAGTLKYRSMNYEDVQPTQNWFTFDDATKILKLSSAPSRSVSGTLRYFMAASTSFDADQLEVVPDAPTEYHWIYVLGLAEYIAKANEEDEKALDYGGQYRNALNVAAQNYQKEGAT